ncbi:MAG: hypothetical protein MRY49_00870 [Candidatus Pacebacteria bacterium]|nr:hypothetical protein [Candidatus Paceibacterota bacterium]
MSIAPRNHGSIKLTPRNEFQDNCFGASGRRFDHVLLYDLEILEGIPFLDEPVVTRLTYLRELGYINHLQAVWLERQGIRVTGTIDLEKADMEVVPVS